MSPEALLKAVKHCIDHRLETVPLSMKVPKSFTKGNFRLNVRTPFGLSRWYPSSREGYILIYPKVEKVVAWLDKNLPQQPTPPECGEEKVTCE